MPHQLPTNDPDACPVPEAVFARLVNASFTVVGEITGALAEDQRSRLAVYCYRRSHLRRLGLMIAARCTKRSLVEEAGHAGELIHFQAQNLEAPVAGDRYMAPRHVKRPVSLHDC